MMLLMTLLLIAPPWRIISRTGTYRRVRPYKAIVVEMSTLSYQHLSTPTSTYKHLPTATNKQHLLQRLPTSNKQHLPTMNRR